MGKSKEINFLSFVDWLSSEEHLKQDWIVIARSIKNKSENAESGFFTFSVIAKLGPKGKNIEKVLNSYEWDIHHTDIGHPRFYKHGGSNKILYDSREKIIINMIEFHPIVFYSNYHGYVESGFEICQSILMFFNAFFVPELQEYQRIDDDGQIHTIAKIINEENRQEILIDSRHLRDFLAANKSFLVRFHDHHRYSTENISSILSGSKFKEVILKQNDYHYCLWLRIDIPFRNLISASRLLGKDIIRPFKKVLDEHTRWAKKNRKEKFVKFITGVDNKGKNIEVTCDEEKLSNYFADRGTPHFLTPVYFERKVLQKYYQEPKRYNVSNHGVKCLDLWGIPIDVTDENLVQVWLGDLGRIPYSEQLYWKNFNVAPRGTITKHRWKTDFLAEFAEPENDPIYYFHKAFDNIQQISKEKLKDALFLPLNKSEKYLYNNIRIPLTDEWKEFNEIILDLSKIIVDSINVPLLESLTERKIDKKEINGSIDLLKVFLERNISKENVTIFLDPFRKMQNFRSCSGAHRKGEKFEKLLKRFNCFNKRPQEIVKDVIVDITRTLDAISHMIISCY